MGRGRPTLTVNAKITRKIARLEAQIVELKAQLHRNENTKAEEPVEVAVPNPEV